MEAVHVTSFPLFPNENTKFLETHADRLEQYIHPCLNLIALVLLKENQKL